MKKAKVISINEAAAQGVERIRKPVWADPCDHLKVDIIDGKPGPWTHLYAPFNMECNGRDPVDMLCISVDYDERCFVPHTGPTPESAEYKAAAAVFNGCLSSGRKAAA